MESRGGQQLGTSPERSLPQKLNISPERLEAQQFSLTPQNGLCKNTSLEKGKKKLAILCLKKNNVLKC